MISWKTLCILFLALPRILSANSFELFYTVEKPVLEAQAKSELENASKEEVPVNIICLQGEHFEDTCEKETRFLAKLAGIAPFEFATLLLPSLSDKEKIEPRPPQTKDTKIRRVLAITRGYVVGTLTGITMAFGQLKAGADPLTIGAAGTIGLAVGAAYSSFLQANYASIAHFTTKKGLIHIDKQKPASFIGNIIKQSFIPIGLGVLMNSVMALTHALVPDVQLGLDYLSREMFINIASLAANSVYFQVFWQRLNRELTDQAIRLDPSKKDKYETKSALATFTLAMLLAVANASHLSGNRDLNQLMVRGIGTAGMLVYGATKCHTFFRRMALF